jgi:UTP--glucose-1-phosphate uridylyltransferase
MPGSATAERALSSEAPSYALKPSRTWYATQLAKRPVNTGKIGRLKAATTLHPTEKVFGYAFEGRRYDAGDKAGMLQATVDFALKRSDLGPGLREYLKQIRL